MVGEALLETALSFLDQYGLVAVFVLLVLDGAMLLPVLPGEVVMILAVARYAREPSDLILLIVVATAAAMVGSLMLYGVARAGGRRLVENHPRLFMMSKRRRERLERAFANPLGQTLVLFLRVIPLTRVLVNIPAGLAKMKAGRFIVLSLIGMLVFHAGFLYVAYEYGQPESEVAVQATAIQETYGTPAWNYLQTNQILAGFGAILLGAVISLRSSHRILRDPADEGRSLFGVLAVRVLFYGGAALAVLVNVRPETVYDYAAMGGLDVLSIAARYDQNAVSLVTILGATAWTLGVVLLAVEKAAMRRRKAALRFKAQEKLIQEMQVDAERNPGRPPEERWSE